MRITSGIDDAVDVHWVPGNHDIAPDATAPTGESIEAYRQVFGPDHYSFTHGDTLFVALNTPVIDHPENVPDEWDRQRGFLEQELGRVGVGGIERAVLVGHHPLFVASPDEPDTYWNLPAERRSVILALAHGAGVRLGLAGHWHRNATATDGDFVQIVSGPVGFPLGADPSGYRVVEVNRGGIDHHYHPLL